MADAAYTSLRDAWEHRFQKSSEEAVLRREKALAAARKVADYLRAEYGVGKILLYGSLAWSKNLTVHSDIDLLVEDFAPADQYWRMLSKASEKTAPFEISIIMAEDASHALLERVRREGLEL
jgi:predicted nucleotidyltransferase